MAKLVLALAVAICLVTAGCVTWSESFFDKRADRNDDAFVRGVVHDLFSSLAYRDTVAQYTWIEGLRKMRVRGYGIVIGLGQKGSAECPSTLRERLVQEMYKMDAFAHVAPDGLTPERLVDDLDTAVVLVQGEIPAAAPEGTRFDLYVQPARGTQTVSLEGGRLLPCELRVYRDVADRASIEGRALAVGKGAVFQNPFSVDEDAATRHNPRRGRIIGGGVSREDRRLRLVLGQPSYRQAMTIARRINERFTGKKIAEAESSSYVRLQIPADYRDDPRHFLELVQHLYLPDRPGFAEQRWRGLADEILKPSAPHADIGLAWEGIGRTVLPTIRELYTDEREYVSFHAALAGMRLGDDLAIDSLAVHAANARSRYRSGAIEALAAARDLGRAAGPLRKLLEDADPRIRVAAYEALRARGDGPIRAELIGRNEFTLERVPGGPGNLVYVTRNLDPRIVFFGDDVRCEPPLFYRHPSGSLTLSALAGESKLTALRKLRYSGTMSPPIPVPFELATLVATLGHELDVDADGAVHGLGVSYSTVVHMLSELCRTHSVNAGFMLDSPSALELFGPLEPPGRPESEL